ncbi:cell wall hydrolase [Thermoactinomyces mirandus]|uniref:Cell wall hydrolase n=1 Tax=Thermoactinomyces mirandus TaxID=2756294 RepID=A0A7W2ARH0_9BACL|nr:cell wall hydrolase [Thermoactinomyces mirandus]MBA4601521.1 cell wall hydrolase [Thermoactinomyces mirandus]
MNIAKSISAMGIFFLAVTVLSIAIDKGYAKMADPLMPERIVDNIDYRRHVAEMEQAESARLLRTGMIVSKKNKPQPVHLSTGQKPEKAVPKHKKVTANQSEKGNTSEFSASEKRLLAKAVYSEARGESFRGQVAVAAVILNRIDHADFPDSVHGVVYQENAFTAVEDGQIHLVPDREAVKAVEKAIQGADPTYGAVYYYNPEIATSDWMKEKAVKSAKTRIGKHVFMR